MRWFRRRVESKNRDAKIELLDGTRYYRTNHIPVPASAGSKLSSYALRVVMVARYRRAVMEIALSERPDVIHAHSSYMNAFAGMPAARRLGLPLLYEVRTLWGESAVVEDGLRPGSWKHRLVWYFELGAMRRADMVVPISKGIREELIARGIPASKLEIVPNGVNTDRFVPMPCDEALAQSVGLKGCSVFGFVGSLRRLEGLSTLVDAYALCRRLNDKIGLVIVGEGPDRLALQAKVKELGLKGVVFTGNVSHKEVAAWYSIMDLVVYPRIRAVINERVTPLKPLEVMALEKVCLGSDVGGLTELIADGETGVIFRSGDAAALADAALALMSNPDRMRRLGKNASEFVRREREWSVIVQRYQSIYDRLVQQKKGQVTPRRSMTETN